MPRHDDATTAHPDCSTGRTDFSSGASATYNFGAVG
jgi:hypothetical protein